MRCSLLRSRSIFLFRSSFHLASWPWKDSVILNHRVRARVRCCSSFLPGGLVLEGVPYPHHRVRVRVGVSVRVRFCSFLKYLASWSRKDSLILTIGVGLGSGLLGLGSSFALIFMYLASWSWKDSLILIISPLSRCSWSSRRLRHCQKKTQTNTEITEREGGGGGLRRAENGKKKCAWGWTSGKKRSHGRRVSFEDTLRSASDPVNSSSVV